MLQAQEFKIGAAKDRNVRIIVKGHLKGIEKDILQELTVHIPADQPNNDQAALLLWQEISRLGGLTIKEDNDTYSFYALTLFSSLTAEFQNIQKVIL
jgi:hypothetical protein